VRLHFGQPVEMTSFSDLLEAMPDTEFLGLTRSTVPLLAWWNEKEHVRAAGESLGLGNLQAGDAWFEYAVSPACASCGGHGKASFTDLLLECGDQVVAIEAKHREKPYATVGEWLGSTPSENKKRVLHHWLQCCIGSAVPSEECAALVYQMVHRTASACHVAARRGATAQVVHLLFGSEHVGAYVRAVQALVDTLALAQRVRFAVLNIPTSDGADFGGVAVDVGLRGPDALREALVEGKRLFNFGTPQLEFTSG